MQPHSVAGPDWGASRTSTAGEERRAGIVPRREGVPAKPRRRAGAQDAPGRTGTAAAQASARVRAFPGARDVPGRTSARTQCGRRRASAPGRPQAQSCMRPGNRGKRLPGRSPPPSRFRSGGAARDATAWRRSPAHPDPSRPDVRTCRARRLGTGDAKAACAEPARAHHGASSTSM